MREVYSICCYGCPFLQVLACKREYGRRSTHKWWGCESRTWTAAASTPETAEDGQCSTSCDASKATRAWKSASSLGVSENVFSLRPSASPSQMLLVSNRWWMLSLEIVALLEYLRCRAQNASPKGLFAANNPIHVLNAPAEQEAQCRTATSTGNQMPCDYPVTFQG